MINTQITNQLYDSIVKHRSEHPFEHWHASSISQCPRAHYYKRLKVTPIAPASAPIQLRWDSGHRMESAIREHIARVFGEGKANERLVSEELDVTGEYDNLVGNDLIEIKSVHDYAFKETVEGGISLKEQNGHHKNGNKKWEHKQTPYLHHELQNHVYAHLLGNIEKIYYVYISLSGRIVTYEEKFKPELEKWVLDRLKLLNTAWKSKSIPDCVCHRTEDELYDSVYRWCDYRGDNECCAINLIKEIK